MPCRRWPGRLKMTSVPVMSLGIRSGVNWMRLKESCERLCERGDEQGLGQAGHAHEQGVVAREDGDEDFVDDVGLADDDLGNLRQQGGMGVTGKLDRLIVIR